MNYVNNLKLVWILFLTIILSAITSCNNSKNNESSYPIRHRGADSIKKIESALSYCGLKLGKEFSMDSLDQNNWRYIETYYEQYNPESNYYIESFDTDVRSEFEDRLMPQSAKCCVYRTLDKDLIYMIDVTINRRDTAVVNAYLLKYGDSNATIFRNERWENWNWEYKNQTINIWLDSDKTYVVYRDSIAIRIHDEEVDSIHKEYEKAINSYKERTMDKI